MQDDQLDKALGYALVRAFRHVNRAHNRALQPFELSAEQAHILLVLWQGGPMKIGDLQRSLLLSSGTLTGAIDRMEKAGLVHRVPDPDDGRAWRIEPAPMNGRRRKAIEETLEKTEEETFSSLDAREQRELFRLLSKLAPR
jgi:DNA-binding MarR family transcriptional regulator